MPSHGISSLLFLSLVESILTAEVEKEKTRPLLNFLLVAILGKRFFLLPE